MQDEQNEQLLSQFIGCLKKSKVKLRDILVSLQEKNIILKSYKIPEEGMKFNPYNIKFNKNFISYLYKASFEMGEELFNAYPQFGNIQGAVVGLRSVSKRFNSLEDAFIKYGKDIGWSLDRHKKILELLEFAKEHNLINYTLASFIIDRRYEELQALKEGDGNINYDTIKFL